ncbi:MAG: alpha/beta fold hydrolase [Myxococcota bacterium]
MREALRAGVAAAQPADPERLARRGEAGWLEGPGGPLFCWYHPPRGAPRSTAVLICDPLGPDRMNLHLTHRALAEHLSAAGLACLRFDPLGTGDASGSPRDDGWPSGWADEAWTAAAHLLARSGARSLALFGARFGGTLALSLAAARPEVAALVAWGPYASGRAFLRSERALERLVAANAGGHRRRCHRDDDEEYVGFVYPAPARAFLERIRVDRLAGLEGLRVKLVAWDDDSDESEIGAALEEAGARIECSRPVGFESDASLAAQRVPEPLLDDVRSWLVSLDDAPSVARRPCAAAEATASTPPTASRPLSTRVRVARGTPFAGTVEESALHFGRDGALFGILSHPAPPAASGDGPSALSLVLVNGGNNHRAGINRNYTEWARESALSGVTTLRFDIRGLGDSPPRRPQDLNQLYRDESREDVFDAIDLVSEVPGVTGVVLVGLCAGAYQAFHAARVDSRVRGLVLLDLLRWDPDPANADPATWLARRPTGLARRFERLRTRLLAGGRAPRSELARGLLELADREVDVLAVSTEQGGSHEMFREALGGSRRRLEASGRFRHEAIRDTNHIFGPLWSQEWVGDRLARFLAELDGRHAAASAEPGEARARVQA